MTYFEIYEKVKAALANADANAVFGKLAIEIDIVGEGEGKFYVLVDNGQVCVEPYDYVDNDARFIATAETIINVAEGKLKPETAYSTGELVIEGNVGRGLEFKALIESIPAPAPAPKKKRRTKAEIEAEKAAKEAAKAEKEAAKEAAKAEKEAAKAAKAKKPAAKKAVKKADK